MAKKLLLITFGLTLGLITAETTARWIGPKDSVFWNNPMMMPYSGGTFDPNTTIESMHENSNLERAQKYVPDPNRWYRLDPEPAIPSTGKVVLNLGDSSTWGWGLADRRTAYATVLNELLLSEAQSVNLGVPYYTTLEGLKYLEELLPRYATQVVGVTLYFGNNDATENGSSDAETLRRVQEQSKTAAIFAQQSALYRLLRFVGTSLDSTKYNDTVRVNPDEYEANLRAMIELCERYNIPVVIIEPRVPLSWPPAHLKYTLSLKDRIRNPWTATELNKSEGLYQEGLEQMYRRDDAYEALLLEAREHDWVIPRIKSKWIARLSRFEHLSDVTVVRLPEVFIGSEYPYAFEDYCHPSARAHEQIARQIAEVFR